MHATVSSPFKMFVVKLRYSSEPLTALQSTITYIKLLSISSSLLNHKDTISDGQTDSKLTLQKAILFLSNMGTIMKSVPRNTCLPLQQAHILKCDKQTDRQKERWHRSDPYKVMYVITWYSHNTVLCKQYSHISGFRDCHEWTVRTPCLVPDFTWPMTCQE